MVSNERCLSSHSTRVKSQKHAGHFAEVYIKVTVTVHSPFYVKTCTATSL